MGSGTYSAAAYTSGVGARATKGQSFAYDRTVRTTGNYKAHDLVDPKKLNSAGKNVREAFDNDDHPETLPIVVGFDATGSMVGTPRIVQTKLANLFGLLVRKGYTGDAYPQIAVADYGDAKTDYVPLQISQFEADNRVDEALDSLFLEGNGGGNGGESAALLWYYLNNHVETDAWKKRNKKGYFFMIADEITHNVTAAQVEAYVGDSVSGDTNLTYEALAKQLQEKWEVFVLLVDNSTAHWQGSKKFYGDLFGEKNVIILENDETVAETIGAVIGKLENDDLDEDELLEDLAANSNQALAAKTVKAVAHLGARGTNVNVAKSNIVTAEDVDDSVKL